jgi:hypothetical protein
VWLIPTNDHKTLHLAATQGVRSRSGEVSVQLQATVVETGEPMTITIDKNGIGERRIPRSHRRDPVTGMISLAGFEEALEQFSEGMARKNKSIQTTNHRTLHNPVIRVDIPRDDFAILRGLAKIAYLMIFRTLGDSFALSETAKTYREAIQATNWDEYDACKLRCLENELPILPSIDAHEHLLACYRIGPVILATVALFGGVSLATFVIPAAGSYGLRILDGSVIVVNSVQRTYTERRLPQAVNLFEKLQQMKQLAASQSAKPLSPP